jgi:hypothetical protein
MDNIERNSDYFQNLYRAALNEIQGLRDLASCCVMYWDDGSVVKDEDFENLSPEQVIALARKALEMGK